MAGITLLGLTACDYSALAALQRGAPPEVPYAVGTTLHLPGGTRVPLDGTSVEVLDATPRGTMLLVERDDPAFDTDYVWVRPDGTRTVLPDTLSHGVQDAVVSPDGRLFAHGGEVVDLRDGSVVAKIPRAATILTGWVQGGIVYGGRRTTYLWRPGHEPFRLDAWTSFPNRSDVGLVARHGCRKVVHVYPGTDYTEEWGTQCGRPTALTVSPGGEWLVTRDLRIVDAAQETSWAPAGGPVSIPSWPGTHWESDHVVLVALGTGVLRCDALERTCEWALDHPAELPLRSASR